MANNIMYDTVSRPYKGIIVSDYHFQIISQSKKPEKEFALNTLLRIESVMKKMLPYAESSQDEFSKLSETDLYTALKDEAKVIAERFAQKTMKLSSFRRFLGIVPEKEKAVQRVLNRILSLTANPSHNLNRLPNELIQHVFSFLPVNDLISIAQVNKLFNSHSQLPIIQRAQNFGFIGDNYTKAKKYIKYLLEFIIYLAKNEIVRKEFVVREGINIDVEATLNKVPRPDLIDGINRIDGIRYGLVKDLVVKHDYERLKFLLKLGLNPNVRDRDGRTALGFATEKNDLNAVKLLLKYGAKVDKLTQFGEEIKMIRPLGIAIVQNNLELVKALLFSRTCRSKSVFRKSFFELSTPPDVFALRLGNYKIAHFIRSNYS